MCAEPVVGDLIVDNAEGQLIWRAEGFWHATPARFADFDAAAAQRYFDIMEAHTDGHPAAMLMDRRNAYSPTFDGLQVLQERGQVYFTHVAFYAPNVAGHLASELVKMTFLRKLSNVAIFRSLPMAEAWITEQIARAERRSA